MCTRLFAFFDVLNLSLNKKVYIISKLVQFPIKLLSFYLSASILRLAIPLSRRKPPKSKFTNPEYVGQDKHREHVGQGKVEEYVG